MKSEIEFYICSIVKTKKLSNNFKVETRVIFLFFDEHSRKRIKRKNVRTGEETSYIKRNSEVTEDP